MEAPTPSLAHHFSVQAVLRAEIAGSGRELRHVTSGHGAAADGWAGGVPRPRLDTSTCVLVTVKGRVVYGPTLVRKIASRSAQLNRLL